MTKKTTFKATDEQLDKLYAALNEGAPLLIALQYAQISRTTYFYWVAVASIVAHVKSQEELEDVEMMVQSGISLQQVRDLSESVASQKRTGIGTFVEPSEESVLQYKNNRKFRKFADQCYEVVSKCDALRSGVVLEHLNTINDSKHKYKNINASGSMWFLERTLPDLFAKPSDKVVESESNHVIEPVKVEFIDPETNETKDRVETIRQDLLAKIEGVGKA